MAGGPILPCSTYLGAGVGLLFPYYYTTTSGSANAAPTEEMVGVAAALSSDEVIHLRFQMPPAIPTGTLKLLTRMMANATNGVIKYTALDGTCPAGSDPGAVTLTAETQSTATWTTANVYVDIKTTLTATPAGNDTLVVAIKVQTSGWTLAQILAMRFQIIWE